MAGKEKEKDAYNDSVERRVLSEQGPARLYVLYGPEDYMRDYFLDMVRHACLDGAESDFNQRRLAGERATVNSIAEAVDAVPFFSEHTIVEVRDLDINKCRESELERMKDIINDIPEYCTLVFILPPDYEPDGRTALMKLLRKQGRCFKFSEQGQAALTKWVVKHFSAEGKSISREDAEYLIFCAGPLMNRLGPEIDKLSARVKTDSVTHADIDECVQKLPEADVFEMTDMLSAGQYDGAASRLGALLASQEEPIKLLALIGMQVRRLYAVKLGDERRLSGAEVMELAGVKYDFILSKLRRAAKRYSLRRLARMVELCAEYDQKMKSTGLDSGNLLRELFARMAEDADAESA